MLNFAQTEGSERGITVAAQLYGDGRTYYIDMAGEGESGEETEGRGGFIYQFRN